MKHNQCDIKLNTNVYFIRTDLMKANRSSTIYWLLFLNLFGYLCTLGTFLTNHQRHHKYGMFDIYIETTILK